MRRHDSDGFSKTHHSPRQSVRCAEILRGLRLTMTEDSSRTDQIIREIAHKCKHVVGHNDPILMVAAFNDRLLAEYRTSVTSAIDQATTSLRSEREEWVKANKKIASKVLTSALQECASKLEAQTRIEVQRLAKYQSQAQNSGPSTWNLTTWISMAALVVTASIATTLTLEFIRPIQHPKQQLNRLDQEHMPYDALYRDAGRPL